MYYVIDNYDSYVYNLIAYMKKLEMDIHIVRCDEISYDDFKNKKIQGIVISPGPKNPRDYNYLSKIITITKGKIPILGVCLGHQMLAYEFGAKVGKGNKPMHGKISKINHSGKNLFRDIPCNMCVTRYHSLIVENTDLPHDLQVEAVSDDGCIMALRHSKLPYYSVQFHPEAVMTEYGYELINNYKKICEGRKI